MSRYAHNESGTDGGQRRIKSWQRTILFWYRVFVLVLGVTVAGIAVWEARTSAIQARVFTAQARKLTYEVQPGPSPAIRFPTAGPHDHRLGYSRLPSVLQHLTAAGFEIESQARFSPALTRVVDRAETV